jgi:hypothetical protein
MISLVFLFAAAVVDYFGLAFSIVGLFVLRVKFAHILYSGDCDILVLRHMTHDTILVNVFLPWSPLIHVWMVVVCSMTFCLCIAKKKTCRHRQISTAASTSPSTHHPPFVKSAYHQHARTQARK